VDGGHGFAYLSGTRLAGNGRMSSAPWPDRTDVVRELGNANPPKATGLTHLQPPAVTSQGRASPATTLCWYLGWLDQGSAKREIPLPPPFGIGRVKGMSLLGTGWLATSWSFRWVCCPRANRHNAFRGKPRFQYHPRTPQLQSQSSIFRSSSPRDFANLSAASSNKSRSPLTNLESWG